LHLNSALLTKKGKNFSLFIFHPRWRNLALNKQCSVV
jgi:hypothetical protein